MKKTLIVLLMVAGLAGCATNVRYVQYTDQKYPPKPKYYFITVYQQGQRPPANEPYYVIGRVDVSGYLSDGVTADTLMDKAKAIARKRGADAIINAKTEMVQYTGVYEEPGYFHRHYYRPPEYIPYVNSVLTLRGELVVFIPTPPSKDEL